MFKGQSLRCRGNQRKGYQMEEGLVDHLHRLMLGRKSILRKITEAKCRSVSVETDI